MSLHLQHLHQRKRLSRTLEPYPARTPWKRVFDRVILGVGILGPIMSFPQIVLIHGGRDASGVSPITFFSWALFDILWIFYGLVHKETPIITTYMLWFVCNTLIFIGAMLYG